MDAHPDQISAPETFECVALRFAVIDASDPTANKYAGPLADDIRSAVGLALDQMSIAKVREALDAIKPLEIDEDIDVQRALMGIIAVMRTQLSPLDPFAELDQSAEKAMESLNFLNILEKTIKKNWSLKNMQRLMEVMSEGAKKNVRFFDYNKERAAVIIQFIFENLRETMNEITLCSVLEGLSNIEDSEEARELLVVLEEALKASSIKMSPKEVSRSIYGLQAMEDCPESKKILQALCRQIEQSNEAMMNEDIGAALYGMQGVAASDEGYSEEAYELLMVIKDNFELHETKMRLQDIDRALYGLAFFDAKNEQVNDFKSKIHEQLIDHVEWMRCAIRRRDKKAKRITMKALMQALHINSLSIPDWIAKEYESICHDEVHESSDMELRAREIMEEYDIDYKEGCLVNGFELDIFLLETAHNIELDGSRHTFLAVQRRRDGLRDRHLKEKLGITRLNSNDPEWKSKLRAILEEIGGGKRVKNRTRDMPGEGCQPSNVS